MCLCNDLLGGSVLCTLQCNFFHWMPYEVQSVWGCCGFLAEKGNMLHRLVYFTAFAVNCIACAGTGGSGTERHED